MTATVPVPVEDVGGAPAPQFAVAAPTRPAIGTQGEPSSSPTIGELATALAQAQADFEHALRTRDGQSGNQTYSYADLATVIDVCRPAMTSNGLSLMQRSMPLLPEDAPGVRIQTLVLHKSGEWISDASTYVPAAGDAKSIGSAMTYARRYSLITMMGIATDADGDDDGTAAVASVQQTKAPADPGDVKHPPFGENAGKPLREISDKDLEWLVNKETRNPKFAASDERLREAARAVLAERTQTPATASQAAPAPGDPTDGPGAPLSPLWREALEQALVEHHPAVKAPDEAANFLDQLIAEKGPRTNAWADAQILRLRKVTTAS